MRLRTQLLLAAIPLLAIPLVGYRSLGEMERFLREGLERSVAEAARALAGALHERRDLLDPLLAAGADAGAIYVHRLERPVAIDGYGEDWGGLRARARVLAGSEPARLLAGLRGDHLYLWVEVDDQRVVHVPAGAPDSPYGDALLLVLADQGGQARRYRLATPAPGWVNARRLSAGRATIEPRIRAEWQDRAGGFAVEVRLPRSLAAGGLAVAVYDSDGPRQVARRVAGDPDAPAPLIYPSALLEGVIESLGRSPGRRIRIIDREGRVLARGGSLERRAVPPEEGPLLAPLGLLLPGAGEAPEPEGGGPLAGAEVDAALAGEPAVAWRRRGERGAGRVRAAHPIWVAGRVVGAVVVEESGAGMQALRRRALVRLFDTSLLVYAAAAASLLGFAALLTWRIRRLRDRAAAAFDARGRRVGTLAPSPARDELGDLARALAAAMARIGGYTDYLEQLARRLSHELRTPLAVVRSSLDALADEDRRAARSPYLERARGGIDRLESTLTRMSEAARLEHTLEDAERQRFDLRELLEAAVAGYAQAWPEPGFRLSVPAEPCPIEASGELLVQMLDKLVENARDFHRSGAPIDIELQIAGRRYRLAVRNRGTRLPERMRGRLFDSLVSVRDATAATPHLGLGLHVVRLIAEHHGATVSLHDLAGSAGVEALVCLPRQDA